MSPIIRINFVCHICWRRFGCKPFGHMTGVTPVGLVCEIYLTIGRSVPNCRAVRPVSTEFYSSSMHQHVSCFKVFKFQSDASVKQLGPPRYCTQGVEFATPFCHVLPHCRRWCLQRVPAAERPSSRLWCCEQLASWVNTKSHLNWLVTCRQFLPSWGVSQHLVDEKTLEQHGEDWPLMQWISRK